jgi:hypothetical protein
MNIYSTTYILPLLIGLAAYLDPGSGSYIIQLIIAGLMGGLFMVGIYWKRLKAYFRNLFSKNDATKRNE